MAIIRLRRPLNASLVLFPLTLIFVSTLSCSSYTDEMQDILRAYRSGSYKGALDKLEKSDLKDEERNRLLYSMEKGSILDRMGETEKAQKQWLHAVREADSLYRRSITGDIASFVYNDSAMDYQGEDYEKVAIHTMLALSYIDLGKLGEARVEARAINTQLDEINNFYKDNKNRYNEDAFARFLSGLIYESKGEADSAIVEYRGALKAYETSYTENFAMSVPQVLVKSLYRLAVLSRRQELIEPLKKKYSYLESYRPEPNSASVVSIHQMGTIANKKATDFFFPWDGKPVRISFPSIAHTSAPQGGTTGESIDGHFAEAELVQNMNGIAGATLTDSRARFIFKMAGRVIIKDQITQEAKKNFGPIGEIAAAIYGAVSETADTRSWTTLPAGFFIARAQIAPGRHTVKISTNGRDSEFKTIDIKAGEMHLFRGY